MQAVLPDGPSCSTVFADAKPHAGRRDHDIWNGVDGFAPPVSKQLFYYLTITYSDPEGKKQSGVFELGKDIVRTMLKILEVRSGKAITFQDADTYRQIQNTDGA